MWLWEMAIFHVIRSRDCTSFLAKYSAYSLLRGLMALNLSRFS